MNRYMRYILLPPASLVILLASAIPPVLAEDRQIYLEGLHQLKDETFADEWMQDLRTGSAGQQFTALDCLGDYGREAVIAILV